MQPLTRTRTRQDVLKSVLALVFRSFSLLARVQMLEFHVLQLLELLEKPGLA